MSFMVFAASKGKYFHPYFSFQSDHVARPTADSPQRGRWWPWLKWSASSCYVPSLKTLSQEIHQAISHKNVFPVGICDEQLTIVNTHANGYGYKALFTIIQMDHPVCHHHPTAYIRAPPKQRKQEALSAYFYCYLEYLRLHAYLKNIDTNLYAPAELDDFIDATHFSPQYCCLICEDWNL